MIGNGAEDREGQGVHPGLVDVASGHVKQVLYNNVSLGASRVAQGQPPEGTSEGLREIFLAVVQTGKYNFAAARRPVPSDLIISAWRQCLVGYADAGIVDFLEYGWPINHDRVTPLQDAVENHPSALGFSADIDHYIEVEMEKKALAGPFLSPPVRGFHVSPLMTRPKRDSRFRRVIMDLSWPSGAAVNDGIDTATYIDGPAKITLPTADYMAQRIEELGPGAHMYKTDLARGYRQLRVDPWDWPLLGFAHRGRIYMDLCPPFGLRTSAMCMQRTAQAVCYLHGRRGFLSKAYLDDFGGAEASTERAGQALDTLQGVMRTLGMVEAQHKICPPSQQMVWLGIHYDTVAMRMTIPQAKMGEVMEVLETWRGRIRATKNQTQSLLGLLQFVASVSPPVRVYTNRMLQCLREMPDRGSSSLSLGFKRDLDFFLRLLPTYNGVRVLGKQEIDYQDRLELDACLTGCGATTGGQYYAEVFPDFVLEKGHNIARLELLNVVVATKVWKKQWSGKRVLVLCDNTNACLAIQSGRSRDDFVQSCIRELFLVTASKDIELCARHCPGRQMGRADALSRMHLGGRYLSRVQEDTQLQGALRVRVPPEVFRITFDP